MAIRGRKPKPPGQARHRNKLVHKWTEVPSVPFRGAPKLPAQRCNGRGWSQRDRKTWRAWSTMPHCVLWQPSDWEFAFTTMEIAARVHDGELRWAAELRARQKVLGTTWEALRDQRIRSVDLAEESPMSAEVARLADYRYL